MNARRFALAMALWGCTAPVPDYPGKRCDVPWPAGFHCNRNGVCETGDGCGPGEITCGPICTSVADDPDNCGSCGRACGSLPHAASVVCKGGNCVPGSCQAGFTDCDQVASNGCEAGTQIDV